MPKEAILMGGIANKKLEPDAVEIEPPRKRRASR